MAVGLFFGMVFALPRQCIMLFDSPLSDVSENVFVLEGYVSIGLFGGFTKMHNFIFPQLMCCRVIQKMDLEIARQKSNISVSRYPLFCFSPQLICLRKETCAP